MTAQDTRTVHARIEGRVQGVWYRAWTVETAQALGLEGWVRNRTDGTVEAVFSGPEDKVADMLEKCRKGPIAAKVTGVHVTPYDEKPDAGFIKRETC